MAKPGFKPGDQVIVTKCKAFQSGKEAIHLGQILIITNVNITDVDEVGYYTNLGYIAMGEECELDQAWYNEQKLKKVLGL